MAEMAIAKKKFFSDREGEGRITATKHEDGEVFPQFDETGFFDVLLVKSGTCWLAYRASDIEFAFAALNGKKEFERQKKHLLAAQEKLRDRAEQVEQACQTAEKDLHTAREEIQLLREQNKVFEETQCVWEELRPKILILQDQLQTRERENVELQKALEKTLKRRINNFFRSLKRG